LFLKRRQGGYAPSPLTDAGSGSQWEPASAYGGMKVSAVWIDGGKAFCFQQWMNPGPSALSECGGWQVTSADVAVLAMRIRVVLQVQQDLARTLALEDPEWRAQRLGRIAMGDIYEAQVAAIDALGEAGTVALPEILQVMDKRPGFYGGEHMIRVFVEASGRDSGRQLHARLQQDLIYWKAIGPTLTQNWLGQLVEPGSPLFMRFHETQLLIHELDREHYAPARQTTAELRDFWISQPQLYDPKWGERDFRSGGTVNEMMRAESFELVEECDAFLKHVGAEKTAP